MYLFTIYLIIINSLSLTLMHMDKYFARKSKMRIRESTLIFFAFVGGSLGSFLGMRLFRHKTRKPKFRYGLPLILLLHISVAIYFLFLF